MRVDNDVCNVHASDRSGECTRKECSQVLFNAEEVCIGSTPPGSCCPKCGGLVRVLMDQALLARNRDVVGVASFISTTTIEKLRHLVDTVSVLSLSVVSLLSSSSTGLDCRQ